MRCPKAQRYISRSIDGELTGREARRLDRHLETCGDCRALVEDLRTIAGGAAKLDAPEPSQAVWTDIKAKLVALERNPAAGKRSELPRPALWPGLPALRFAGVAALAVVFVVSGIVVGLRLGRRGVPTGPEAGKKYTLAKLDEAEAHYRQAIRALSQAFASEKGTLAPQVVELFERNLGVIDSTIRACRAAVLAEPDDLQARSYLLAAYTEKVTLLDSALGLGRQDGEPKGKGKIL
jgi:hypothetical protein